MKDKMQELLEEERKEKARILNLEFEEECRNDRDEYFQKKYDSNMKDSDFL
jgi:hypothetical protein